VLNLQGLSKLSSLSNTSPRRLAIFCGSAHGFSPDYRAAAEAFGAECVVRGYGVVYGGGRVGLMGVIADAVLNADGEVIGVLPEFLSTKELRHDGLTQLEIVPSKHARKARMAELAGAFVALPGGLGTLDELCEILTWSQLGLHQKPVGLLNTRGYFDPLVALVDRAVSEGFCRTEHRQLFCVANEPVELLDRLERFVRPATTKWLDAAEQT
jgi:uncharacterized protein (TIGR00730 family)